MLCFLAWHYHPMTFILTCQNAINVTACVALFLYVGLSVCLCAGVKCEVCSVPACLNCGIPATSQVEAKSNCTLHRMLKPREALGEGDCPSFSLFQHNIIIQFKKAASHINTNERGCAAAEESISLTDF